MISYHDLGLKLHNNRVMVEDATLLTSSTWDKLVYTSVFGDVETRIQTRWVIGEVARLRGIYTSSIHNLYHARSTGEIPDNFTVPALNLRGLGYDSARAIFKAMVKDQVGAVIFELAASEMEYTAQSPEEYVTVVLAAAVRESYQGPVFVQADHTQLRAQNPGVAKEGEAGRLESHIIRCLDAGFFNIDIDASTLVDLSRQTIAEQQASNIDWTARLTKLVRSKQPSGVTVSIGGEIGHIGDQNSTVDEFVEFMHGLSAKLGEIDGIVKVSVQTGTSHGGVVHKDGTLGKMDVDFALLKNITKAGKKYGVGGSVQHGASTLPDSDFALFPRHHTLEIHLATGWQNLLLDSKSFPSALKRQMYKALLKNNQSPGLTDAQYLYKERKRLWGKYKQAIWDIEESSKHELRQELTLRAEQVFAKLGVAKTQELIQNYAIKNNKPRSIRNYQGD